MCVSSDSNGNYTDSTISNCNPEINIYIYIYIYIYKSREIIGAKTAYRAVKRHTKHIWVCKLIELRRQFNDQRVSLGPAFGMLLQRSVGPHLITRDQKYGIQGHLFGGFRVLR